MTSFGCAEGSADKGQIQKDCHHCFGTGVDGGQWHHNEKESEYEDLECEVCDGFGWLWQSDKEGPTFDLDHLAWESIKKAASESQWMPPEYCMGDWVSDVCSFLRNRE